MHLKPLHWLGFAFAALLAGLFAAAPASAQVNSRITCESWQFRYAQCPVPSIIDARISRVIAGDCRPGNWGYDRSGVWVNNGCRAVFDVAARGNSGWGGSGGSGGGNNQIVRCESWQFKPARCNMDTRGGVRIQRVIAGNCQQNQTWGWDRSAVWVNGGCRADFISASGSGGGNVGGGWGWGGSGGSGGNNGGNTSGQLIECSSWEFKPARCPVRVQNSVRLERVNGGECVQGRTWGWDRNGIWVNDGCRARFRVY